jgi:biotin transport system substrate-specific component
MNSLKAGTGVLQKPLAISRSLELILGIGLFALLTALGAFVRIPLPFTPVPITMQTFFVLLSGLYLRNHSGSISQGIYLLLGAIGLPIFAGATGGISVLLGPTGGYLVGFAFAPLIISLIFKKARSLGQFSGAVISLAAGTAVIHALGTINLALLLGIDPWKSLLLGSAPFIPGDLIKILVGAEIFTMHNKFFRK